MCQPLFVYLIIYKAHICYRISEIEVDENIGYDVEVLE